jgi:hypothetical protein
MWKKGQIGQIITSFPALIFVFVIMFIFVIISGFISVNRVEDYSLIDDFLDDDVFFDGEIVKVTDLIGDFCVLNIFDKEDARNEINKVLRNHFIQKYGSGNYFAFTRLGRVYFWSMPLEEYDVDDEGDLSIGDNGAVKFNAFFDSELKNVEVINGEKISERCDLDEKLHMKWSGI